MTLLTMDQLAERLHVSRRTVERLVRQGRIRVVRPSPGTVRVEEREVAAYLASLRRVA